MPSLDDIRQQYPEAASLTDHEIVQKVATANGWDAKDAAEYLDYKPSGGLLKDTATDVARGVVDLAKIPLGAADLASGGAASRGLKAWAGKDLNDASNDLAKNYSDQRQDANQAVAGAHGFLDTAKATLANPRAALGGLVQSLPSMAIPMGAAGKVGGAFLDRGLAAAAKEGLTGDAASAFAMKFAEDAGAKGATNAASSAAWAAMSGTQEAADYAHEHPNDVAGMYTAAGGTALGTGLLTHGFSLLPGGGAAQQFGSQLAGNEVKGGLLRGTATAMANQGLMMGGMSGAQKASVNYAEGKPWDDDIGSAIGGGMVNGLGFGLAHGVLHRENNPVSADARTLPMDGPQVLDPAAAAGAAPPDPIKVKAQGNTKDLPHTDDERDALFKKYGEPVPRTFDNPDGTQTTDGTDWIGKHLPLKDASHGDLALDTHLNKQAIIERAKSPSQRDAEQALADTMRDQGLPVTPETLGKAADALDAPTIKAIVTNAPDPRAVVTRMDDRLKEADTAIGIATKAVDQIQKRFAKAKAEDTGLVSPEDVKKKQDKLAEVQAKRDFLSAWKDKFVATHGDTNAQDARNASPNENASAQAPGSPAPIQGDAVAASRPDGGPDTQSATGTSSAEDAGRQQVRVPSEPAQAQQPVKSGWWSNLAPDVAARIEKASATDRSRIRLALGYDTEGHQSLQPMTHEMIAKTLGGDKSTVTKALARHGFTEAEIDKHISAVPSDERAAELEAATHMANVTGMDTIDSPDQTHLDAHLTPKQQQLQAEGNRVLKENKAVEETRTPEEIERDKEFERKRAELAQTDRLLALHIADKSPNYDRAQKEYNMLRQKGDVRWDDMHPLDRAEWVARFDFNEARKVLGHDDDLESHFKEHQEKLKDEALTRVSETVSPDGAEGSARPADGEALPATGTEVRPAGDGSHGTADTGKPAATAPAITVKPRRRVVERPADAQFGHAEPVADAHTAESLKADLQTFMRADSLGRNVEIVDTPEQLRDLTDVTLGVSNPDAFGWTRDGKVVLVASRISKADGRSAFMHEVGAHLGIDKMLPDTTRENLADQITSWAKANDDSLESKIAKQALRRVEAADTPDEALSHETIAYFVEEATKAGVDPTALQYKTPLERFFSTVMRAFATALKKIGIDMTKLKAQDIVDLAYGAAQLELKNSGAESVTAKGGDPEQAKFGKNAPAAPTQAEQRQGAEKVIAKLPRTLQNPVRRIFAVAHDVGSRASMATAFMHDLSDWAAKHGITAAKDYALAKAKQGAYKTERDNELGKLAKRLETLKPDAQLAMQQFTLDSTRRQKWGYQPAWRDAVTIDPEMQRAYDALKAKHPEAAAMADEMFKYSEAARQAKIAAAKDLIQTQYTQLLADAKDSPEKVAELEKQQGKLIADLTGSKMDGPYAPLQRFGSHVITVRSKEFLEAAKTKGEDYRKMLTDPVHNQNIHVDGAGEAAVQKARLKEQFPEHEVQSSRESEHTYIGASYDTLNRLGEAIKERIASGNHTEGEKAISAAISQAIREAVVQSIGEHTARTNTLHRQNIAGVNASEMNRAFFRQGYADNNMLANVLHNKEIQGHMAEMRKQVYDEKDPDGRGMRQNFYNEMLLRSAANMNTGTPPWIGQAMRFTSAWKLVTSPAYYLQYLSQPISMMLPVLAGDHGGVKGWAAMGQGFRDVKALSKGLFSIDVNAHKDAGERAMLQELTKSGTISIGHESMYGRTQTMPEHGFSRQWARAMDLMTSMPHSVELHNRVASALAAYRLELAKTGDAEKATEYARKSINTAYGDYSSFNAPRITQGSGVTKLMTQYRQFQIIHTSMLVRLLHNGFAGETPDVRRAAKLQLAYMFVHYGALAGAVGMPAMGSIANAARAVFGDDNDVDTDTFLKRHIQDKAVYNMVSGGLPKVLFGQDLAQRMGAGDILSPFKTVDMGNALQSKAGYKDAALAVMGPFIGGMVPQVIDGVNQIAGGDYYRGLEQLMPKGIGDAMKGYRYTTEGVVDRKGSMLAGADKLSAGDIAGAALGSRPTTITEPQHDARVVREIEQQYKDMGNHLKSAFVQAKRNGNDVSDLRDKWQAMQEKMAAAGMKKAPLSELLKAPMTMGKRDGMVIDGVHYTKKDKGLVKDVTGADAE